MAAAKAAENHGDEAWLDIYDEWYIHKFWWGSIHKI